MTSPGSTRERPEWRDWPELRVIAPATLEGTDVPARIETAPSRYAQPSTVNHERWRAEHRRCLATEAAPSAPLALRRRRIDWQAVAAAIGIVVVIALIYLFLENLPRIAVA